MKMPDWLKNTLCSLGGVIGTALLLWILGVFVQPVGDFFVRVWQGITGEALYTVAISTAVPSCVTGFVPGLLAPQGQSIPANLEDGADRTYICDNATISAEQSEITSSLAKKYPGCFTYAYMLKPTLTLNRESVAVCRAHYQVDPNGRPVPTSYELGVNICLGAQGVQYHPSQAPYDANTPRNCTDDELRAQGFLPR
jgi:hypothetical protein